MKIDEFIKNHVALSHQTIKHGVKNAKLEKISYKTVKLQVIFKISF